MAGGNGNLDLSSVFDEDEPKNGDSGSGDGEESLSGALTEALENDDFQAALNEIKLGLAREINSLEEAKEDKGRGEEVAMICTRKVNALRYLSEICIREIEVKQQILLDFSSPYMQELFKLLFDFVHQTMLDAGIPEPSVKVFSEIAQGRTVQFEKEAREVLGNLLGVQPKGKRIGSGV